MTKNCKVCGRAYKAGYGKRAAQRVTCSRACAATWKRQHGTDRTGAANPNYRHGDRTGAHVRSGARVFKDPQLRCRAPGCVARAVNQHHVVYQQHVRRAGGDEWDPDNALALCAGHHTSHHQRGCVLPIAALRSENLAFAETLLGDAANDYLARYYDATSGEFGWVATPSTRHGTVNGYVVDRCRCEACRAAKAEYEKQRRNRKPVINVS